MNNEHLCSVKYATILAVTCSLLIPPAVQGYATNYDYAVDAKWDNNLNFMVCLSYVAGKEYEHLFIKALDEWKEKWNHFHYTLSRGSGCHINVHIVKTNSMLTDHGYSGHTYLEYWERGAITKAEIVIPTHAKSTVSTVAKGKTITKEVVEPLSKTLFYRAALHEFGHALNLGHFDDNGEEPIDIMYPYPASDDQAQGISQRDINALNWLYLGFFEQEIKVRTDKISYNTGEMVKISGKVNPLMREQSIRLLVLDPDEKVYSSDSVRLGSSGTFTYQLKIPKDMGAGGTFSVKASYYNMLAKASFDIYSPSQEMNEEVGRVNTTETEDGNKEMKVSVLEALIVDTAGSKVASIQPHEQVFIRSSLSNEVEEREVTYIVQIKSSEGYTEEISSATYTLASGSSTFALSWLPSSPGKFEIQLFLWKSISPAEPLMYKPVELDVIVA